MERNVSLIRAILFALLAGLALLACDAAASESRLVLVASARSPIAALSQADVRRLYLGIPSTQDGHEIIPVRNAVDHTVQEIFLQRVLFMSSQAYERQISARLYRTGGNRVAEYFSLRELAAALHADPWAVSYMSETTAQGLAGIKIVALL